MLLGDRYWIDGTGTRHIVDITSSKTADQPLMTMCDLPAVTNQWFNPVQARTHEPEQGCEACILATAVLLGVDQ